MRSVRLKVDDRDAWYHCYNRIAGTEDELPFGDTEKEMFVRILNRVCDLYAIRVVAYQVMSNHFHLLVNVPKDAPGPEEVCRRYEKFYQGRRSIYPNSGICALWQLRCRDVSWFMRHLQHLFAVWFNRTRPSRRRGSLWADRFKNTLLEDGVAVWSCWTYIENNPVRARIVARAVDYRFSSIGVWHQKGRHPFERNLKYLMLPMLAGLFGVKNLMDVRRKLDDALCDRAVRDGRAKAFSLLPFQQVRYWTNGLVIGSELFVRNTMASFVSGGALFQHKVSHADSQNHSICAWRRGWATG